MSKYSERIEVWEKETVKVSQKFRWVFYKENVVVCIDEILGILD